MVCWEWQGGVVRDVDDIRASMRKCHDMAISGARQRLRVDSGGGETSCGALQTGQLEIGRQRAAIRWCSGIQRLWIQRLRDAPFGIKC